MFFKFLSIALLGVSAAAAPLSSRQETVSNVVCSNASALDSHTVNVALLQICGGIAGSIEFCQGNPTSTTGDSGNVRFTITPVDKGATINISKGRWEQGIKAAFAQCGQDIPFTATFTGGASTGDVNVKLEQV
ncbi:uncharacterized protein FOMMEDRAFT_23189 [Fomitiporia mediterranea MF3/22]|uniref:uncharacterized protein n=1 Tax=Fomitiporia mediterranea (strain MF3/22) TaxID=694068 RepID=UPI0004407715|nr:uncharacterized protein FOMMEDRAFT_23189 [Fomitiporia mediterranea MF3/22]EJC99310.1 hypothetical protein FOMMEDRAFT_23189 [Fomitiporia mediterranea MF3/22]